MISALAVAGKCGTVSALWNIGSAAFARYSLRGKLRRIRVHKEGHGLDLNQWVTIKVRWAFSETKGYGKGKGKGTRRRSRSRGRAQSRSWR